MMEYHEIGERFEYDSVVLEVVEYNPYYSDNLAKACWECYFNFKCQLPCYCSAFERKDRNWIFYKLVEQCKTKDMKHESKKNDRLDNKLRWELLPLEDMEDIVKVYTAGAKKYGPNTWQNLPDGYQRYKAALFRHLVEYEKGNWLDPDTGCISLAQVAWNAIAMLHIAKQNMKNNECTICSKKEELLTEAKDTPEK